MSRPENLRYTPTHEWVRVEGDVAEVGITDHAVKQLNEPTGVELPKKGARTTQGAPFGEIESVKSASPLIAPVSGEIIDVNTRLMDDITIIKSSPFEAGWLIRIRMSDPAELESLLSAPAYAAHIATEEH